VLILKKFFVSRLNISYTEVKAALMVVMTIWWKYDVSIY